MTEQLRKTIRELRRFGFVMTIPLLVIGILLVWRGRASAPYFIGLAVLFLLAALVFPSGLRPVERAWMALARVLSIVMTYVILTLTFYLIITPVGLILRVFGKDLLQKKFESVKTSYWIPVEPDGPCSRHDKPY
jgi:hypothetical protein